QHVGEIVRASTARNGARDRRREAGGGARHLLRRLAGAARARCRPRRPRRPLRLKAVEQTYFRKGFGLKGVIEGALTADYHSQVVDAIRAVTADDVVILPAFGVTVRDFDRLRAIGCVLVDTTCGSVLNVWKRVESYARDGFMALIHGKNYHEETKATSSQVNKYPGGKYLVVRDMAEARIVCNYIEQGEGSREQFVQQFKGKMSPGFDPDRDLDRVGVANQTTMLSGESLAIAAEVRKSMARRWGDAALPEHFRTFDTICSATQERQDAVLKLIAEPLDLMVVIGGYNSSNK